MAYVGDANRQLSTFIIGDGTMTSDGTTTFTNPPPDTGVNYYVFIRLYSSIDVSKNTGLIRLFLSFSYGEGLIEEFKITKFVTSQ